MIALLTSIFTAIGEALGLVKQKDAQRNTSEMQAAARGQQERQACDKTAEAIKRNDLDELRKEAAE